MARLRGRTVAKLLAELSDEERKRVEEFRAWLLCGFVSEAPMNERQRAQSLAIVRARLERAEAASNLTSRARGRTEEA